MRQGGDRLACAGGALVAAGLAIGGDGGAIYPDSAEAWIRTVTGGGAFVLLVTAMLGHPARPRSATPGPEHPLARLARLGFEIADLVTTCSPPEPQGDDLGWDGQAMLGKLRPLVEKHLRDRDTVAIYRNRFAPRVRTAVASLVADGAVGPIEANWLNTPTDVTEIALVGRRLVEIAQASAEPTQSTD